MQRGSLCRTDELTPPGLPRWFNGSCATALSSQENSEDVSQRPLNPRRKRLSGFRVMSRLDFRRPPPACPVGEGDGGLSPNVNRHERPHPPRADGEREGLAQRTQV